MDKEEFRIKLEEINKLVQKKDYKGAMSIVDSIDWRRVKNVRTLCVVGEIYAANGRYEDSREIFLLAYHKASIGKNILYRLVEISLKLKDMDEAVEFFEEYKQVASNDNTQYILQYKIARARNASLNEQIRILEEYKEQEFTEKWSYELAVLYYKAGDKEKCLDLCNEIILWFSEGRYVTKAYDLKMRMGELTGEEKERYERQFVPKLITPQEAKVLEAQRPVQEEPEKEASEQHQEISEKQSDEKTVVQGIDSIPLDERDLNGMESIQEKITKGIRDIFGGKKKDEEEELEENSGDVAQAAMEVLEEEIPDELIRSRTSVRSLENVPELEDEDGKPARADQNREELRTEPKADFSATMKMPELRIPASMKNMELQSTPKIPEVTVKDILSDGETSGLSFNLEDTILAAATAQGIEIPKEEQKKQEQQKKEEQEQKEALLKEPALSEEIQKEPAALKDPETETEKKIPDLVDEELEEPEFLSEEMEEDLTEEDLRIAEEEFLHGPISAREITEPEDIEEAEEFFEEEPTLDEDIPEILEEEPVLEEKPLTEEEELEKFIETLQPKDDRDPDDIVPRERVLRDDEKQLFSYFVKVPGMNEQLVDTLCDVQMAAADKTSKTGNIIVMGGRECGKTRLISGLIPAICKELNLEASKVAYVFAEQINGKNIYKIFAKLAGGFLVIENANQLTQETVDMLDRAMEANTDGLTVVIEDEKIGMRKLIARFPKFAKKFTSMINIPVFTNDELVNFARVYTKENGYTIDQMGMLALYNLIGINQKEDEPMNVGAVKDLIDSAIARSQGGIRKFKRNISKKRTDHDGYVVLYEKDFSK